MRRFDDSWVVDRTMFEYVNQGGCSCCGVTHQIMDVAMFASQCSDWESDDEKKEQFSPWPSFIHDEILTERARLRVVMKADMKHYKTFLDTHFKEFSAWWSTQSEASRSRIFQAPDEDVMAFFRTHARIKGSYEIVLCAVLEQLRHFKDTQYKDARTSAESTFESALQHQRECFTVAPSYQSSATGAVNFVDMLRVLGGPKLLPMRQTQDPAENNEFEKESAESVANVQSFRSDRRLLRLVILRAFADVAMRKFLRETGRGAAASEATNNEKGGMEVDMEEEQVEEEDNQRLGE